MSIETAADMRTVNNEFLCHVTYRCYEQQSVLYNGRQIDHTAAASTMAALHRTGVMTPKLRGP